MRSYKQLDLEERCKIETWPEAKVSVDVIAERLGRNRSTIFRELRRNHFTDPEMPRVVGYFGVDQTTPSPKVAVQVALTHICGALSRSM